MLFSKLEQLAKEHFNDEVLASCTPLPDPKLDELSNKAYNACFDVGYVNGKADGYVEGLVACGIVALLGAAATTAARIYSLKHPK